MQITSPAFQNNTNIPQRYTAAGENISPPLLFSDVPGSAESLALIVEDLDAVPEPWTHWLVFNISARVTELKEGALPEGSVEGLANGRKPGYEGPNQPYFCGVHRYRFRLIAVDALFDLPRTADKTLVMLATLGHELARADLIGLAKGSKACS